MGRMRLVVLIACGIAGLTALAAPAPIEWEKPASALADQISGILGPGQAQLTIRNLSTITAAEVPTIRRLLEQGLKTHGVLASGIESANAIRITLSESARERLWVAEVVEGNETRTVMVQVDHATPQAALIESHIMLRKEPLAGLTNSLAGTMPDRPVLSILETSNGILVLRSEEIAVFAFGEGGWKVVKTFPLETKRPQPRDPRGVLAASTEGNSFSAFTAGSECDGSFTTPIGGGANVQDGWSIRCRTSDDPWTISENGVHNPGSLAVKAFYNSARNYFTGAVTLNLGTDLPPFYSAGLIPRPGGEVALVMNGIDGKVLMVDNGSMRTVTGTRDWGSDFAILHSGCSSGTQIIASASGEAVSDSLRAFELPSLEAIPVSAPLTMNGAVTAIFPARDAKSAFAVVRTPANAYEVDRVTALCN